MAEGKKVKFSYDKLNMLCMDAFQKLGFNEQKARIITDVLLTADLYGIQSHGMQRMVRYYKGIQKGTMKVDAEPEVIFETPISAVVDGHNGMGQLNGHFAMDLAIKKAKEVGVGIVTVRNSNHYGIAGYYAKMTAKENMLGFSCTNSEAIMVPTYASKAMIGSNPQAWCVPADPYDFLFDASTTVVTRGKLEMYNKLGKKLPDGWALDKDGQPTNNAGEVLSNIVGHVGGGIMPLGGNTEELGSHKGYGNGMVAEIFSSILSQGLTSDLVMKDGKAGTCHGFMAINLASFGEPEAIKKHFSEYLQALRDAPKAAGQERIYTHGEKEMAAIKDRKENGIPVIDKTMTEVYDLCQYLDLDFTKYFGDYVPPKADNMFTGNY